MLSFSQKLYPSELLKRKTINSLFQNWKSNKFSNELKQWNGDKVQYKTNVHINRMRCEYECVCVCVLIYISNSMLSSHKFFSTEKLHIQITYEQKTADNWVWVFASRTLPLPLPFHLLFMVGKTEKRSKDRYFYVQQETRVISLQ